MYFARCQEGYKSEMPHFAGQRGSEMLCGLVVFVSPCMIADVSVCSCRSVSVRCTLLAARKATSLRCRTLRSARF